MKKAVVAVVMAVVMIGIFAGCMEEKEDFVCEFCKRALMIVRRVFDVYDALPVAEDDIFNTRVHEQSADC